MGGITLSIITVHLNNFDGLKKTLNSLGSLLECKQVQWVVVDGRSSPLNERHRLVFDSVRESADALISEPDAGIYDAMNKGTNEALGDYLLYLNAGDELHSDFNFAAISRDLDEKKPVMLWGHYDESGRSNRMRNIRPRQPSWLWWGMPTSHQAILFNKKAVGKRPYDTALKIAGDYDLVLKLYRKGAQIAHTQEKICIQDATGVSNVNLKQAFTEQMRVRTKYYGTSKIVNLAISTSRATIGWVGRIGFLRRIWK